MPGQERPERKADERRPYRRPRLVDYGAIAALTLSGIFMGSIFDLMQMKLRKKP